MIIHWIALTLKKIRLVSSIYWQVHFLWLVVQVIYPNLNVGFINYSIRSPTTLFTFQNFICLGFLFASYEIDLNGWNFEKCLNFVKVLSHLLWTIYPWSVELFKIIFYGFAILFYWLFLANMKNPDQKSYNLSFNWQWVLNHYKNPILRKAHCRILKLFDLKDSHFSERIFIHGSIFC